MRIALWNLENPSIFSFLSPPSVAQTLLQQLQTKCLRITAGCCPIRKNSDREPKCFRGNQHSQYVFPTYIRSGNGKPRAINDGIGHGDAIQCEIEASISRGALNYGDRLLLVCSTAPTGCVIPIVASTNAVIAGIFFIARLRSLSAVDLRISIAHVK